MANNKLLNWLLFILLSFIWGSSFILMKASRQGLSATQIAGLRIFSAGLVFLPFAIFNIRRIPRQKIAVVAVTGLLGNLFPAFLFAAAIFKTDSSLAGILNSLTPISVVIIGSLFFNNKASRQKVIGVVIGFVGLCLLTLTRKDISMGSFGYSLLIILATVCYGVNVNIVGHYLKGIKPLHTSSVSLSFMLIPAGIALLQQGFLQLNFLDPVVSQAVLLTVLLGVAGSALATLLFYSLVQRAGGLFASLVTYGIPFVALFWGFLDGEDITLVSLICLLLILAGVFLANRPDNSLARAEAAKNLTVE
ncbi:MAG: DMT family transporter [Chitinophagaceae bacterium]|nr:DMT family transporter [Chitinophagaceae bacterium]